MSFDLAGRCRSVMAALFILQTAGCVARAPANRITLSLGDQVAMEFVLIPEGKFLMGSKLSTENSDPNEHPRHHVSVKPFYLGRFEVMVAQFRRFVEETGYLTDAERGAPVPEKFQMRDGALGGYSVDADGSWRLNTNITWRDPGLAQSESHPVVLVSWNYAQAFCAWLSEKTSRRIRLPSEAEWEYACRGGRATVYWWGDEPDSTGRLANLAGAEARRAYEKWRRFGLGFLEGDDGFVHSAPVGTFGANPFGLHDMIGNAWEWCEDIWQPNFEGAPADGSAWIATRANERRVFRGGCWGNGVHGGRCSWSASHSASFRGTNFGFRVALEITD